MLSRDQMLAVNHGILSNESWTVAPIPTGDFEIPSWVLDLRVDWMGDYANRPRIQVLTDGTEFDGDWRFRYENGLYLAEIDGRLQWHSHGPLSLVDDEYWADGETRIRKILATRKSEGYGGRYFQITMESGETAYLRGPWHVSAPEGFVEIGTYNKNQRYGSLKHGWPLTGSFGLAVRDELFLRLLARFQPHLRAAYVKYHGLSSLEPRKAGEAPKNMQIENQDLSGD